MSKLIAALLFARFLLIVVPYYYLSVFVKRLVRYFTGQEIPHNRFLSGNYAPTFEELHLTDLPVIGELPKDIDGMYVRNGPNPHFVNKEYHHWWAGDGMLHGIQIKDGKATYINKWVRTEKWKDENKAGKALHFTLSDFTQPHALFKLIYLTIKGKITGTPLRINAANTSVEYHANKCLALLENSLPTHVTLPQMETVGEVDYEGKLSHSMTAHPKIDSETGELFFFGQDLKKEGIICYSIVSKEGKLKNSVYIPAGPKRSVSHDFSITKKYAIFYDIAFVSDGRRLIDGRCLFTFDPSHQCRIGVFPRYSLDPSDIKWFPINTCSAYHTINSYELEDGETIVLTACRSRASDYMGLVDEKEQREFYDTYTWGDVVPLAHEWRLNMRTGGVQERCLLPDCPVEFPTINIDYTGRKNRYTYLAALVQPHKNSTSSLTAEDFIFNFDSVIKFDLQEGTMAAVHKFGGSSGECVYWAKEGAVEEDDGYLGTFVYEEAKNTSYFAVLDAKSLTLLARVQLPKRVPHGFHGRWFYSEQIDAQIM